ncbi:ABC transporter permease [uncultured Ruminococcus sp.]|uniref:ABC transporter permease n=1 Tax=uncultured Ruminococcus sp. TaxID=165186 RepID=UPI0025E7CE4C|nr:ABC transporter permease [uncultured Ruminococcus sp.]
MKQFKTILKFELLNYIKNKVFVGITIFLVAAIAVVMFFPLIAESFGSQSSEATNSKPVMLIVNDAFDNSDMLKESFSTAFADYDVQITNDGIDSVKSLITSETAECAFVIKSDSEYDYYVNNNSLYDEKTMVADSVLQNIYRVNAMVKSGVSPQNANEIMNVQIEHNTTSLGKDQTKNFFYTYIMIFALYMVILLYGQMVATNVATEKSSRAMELLITSAKPVSMMFGKVIASCIAGLIQLVAVFGSAFLFYNMNKSYWGDNFIIKSIFDMPLDLLLYMLLFFILGFFIYAFLYGAIGSTASKVEDINTSVMPLTFIFIAAFMVVMFSMSADSVDNLLMRVCSYIPFTSPMAMFTRIAMSTVPIYEIIISVVILIASVIGIGVISAKIYRVGVLLYGTPPKLGAILKAIKKS